MSHQDSEDSRTAGERVGRGGGVVSYWCLTPSQPVRLSQGGRGSGGKRRPRGGCVDGERFIAGRQYLTSSKLKRLV